MGWIIVAFIITTFIIGCAAMLTTLMKMHSVNNITPKLICAAFVSASIATLLIFISAIASFIQYHFLE